MILFSQGWRLDWPRGGRLSGLVRRVRLLLRNAGEEAAQGPHAHHVEQEKGAEEAKPWKYCAGQLEAKSPEV